MKNILLFIILSLLITNCGNSQNKRKLIIYTGNVNKDIGKYFPEGIVNVDIMDGVKQSERQIELMNKLKNSIRKNYDWFLEYIKTTPKDNKMPYHPNLGLTKKEYDELSKWIEKIEIISTGQEKLKIIKTDTTITFFGKGKLKHFNSIKIDLKRNIIIYKNYKLMFNDKIIVDDANNGFKSRWKGYSWEYSFPKNVENLDFNNLENISIGQVKFTIGQLEKEKRIYIEFKERIVRNGIKIKDIQIPILF